MQVSFHKCRSLLNTRKSLFMHIGLFPRCQSLLIPIHLGLFSQRHHSFSTCRSLSTAAYLSWYLFILASFPTSNFLLVDAGFFPQFHEKRPTSMKIDLNLCSSTCRFHSTVSLLSSPVAPACLSFAAKLYKTPLLTRAQKKRLIATTKEPPFELWTTGI